MHSPEYIEDCEESKEIKDYEEEMEIINGKINNIFLKKVGTQEKNKYYNLFDILYDKYKNDIYDSITENCDSSEFKLIFLE